MNTYVLILTMIYNGGVSGVTAVEMNSLGSCKAAGERWKQSLVLKTLHYRGSANFECLKK